MLDQTFLEKIFAKVGTYIDPRTGEDLTFQLVAHLANQIEGLGEKFGFTNYDDIDWSSVNPTLGGYASVKSNNKSLEDVRLFNDLYGTSFSLTDFAPIRSNTYEWVWNVYTDLGEHAVLKNKESGFEFWSAPKAVGDKEGIRQIAEPLVKYLNDNKYGYDTKLELLINPTPSSIHNGNIFVSPNVLENGGKTSYINTLPERQEQRNNFSRVYTQLAGIVNPNSTGGAWSTQSGKKSGPGLGPQEFLRRLTESFISKTGLTDLTYLGARNTYDADSLSEVTEYYDTRNGNRLNFNGYLGEWGEGPGVTSARISGGGQNASLTTYGEDSTSSWIAPVLAIASFVPGLQPFAIGVNIGLALDRGDVLGAVASVAGLVGLKDVATFARFANAVKNGDTLGAALSAASISGIGDTKLVGNITVKDVLNIAKAKEAIDKKDYGAALTIAGQTLNNQELAAAGQGIRLMQAMQQGKIENIANAALGIKDIYSTDAQNVAAKKEGWTGINEKTTARNFYGNDVTPEQWKQLGQYVDYSTGEAYGNLLQDESKTKQQLSQSLQKDDVASQYAKALLNFADLPGPVVKATGNLARDSSGNLLQIDDSGNIMYITGPQAGGVS